MEELIEKFNELVNEMANAVAGASTLEEAEKIQSEYDIKIDEAEKQLDSDIEVFLEKQNKELEAEQKASELEIEGLADEEGENTTEGKDPEEEKLYLIENATDAKFIASRYNISNDKKNNFSTREIAEVFEVDTKVGGKNKTEKQLSEEIFKVIEGLR